MNFAIKEITSEESERENSNESGNENLSYDFEHS
jgi:hypothetical protein